MNPETDDLEALDPTKPMRLVYALLLSLPLFGVGFVVEQTIRLTNHMDGLLNGLFHMAFFCLAAPIYLIPWALIVHFCYRKRASQARRTMWMLGLSVVMSLLPIAGLFIDPPTLQNRFKRFTKTELPTDISDLRTNFRGGGLSDYGDTYYFKTSSAQIDRFIREMKPEEDKYYSQQKSLYSIIKALPDSPDYRKWVGAKKFTAWDDRKCWFYHLITDATKTQAYVIVCCI